MNSKLAIAILLVLGLAVTFASAPASGAVLRIHFTGLDLKYDGSNLYDATNIAGGTGNSAEADELTALDFFLDGVPVAGLSSDIYADVLIQNVLNIPAAGSPPTVVSSNTTPFGFDLLTSTASSGAWGLQLELDQLSFDLFDPATTGGELKLWAHGAIADTGIQNLPPGLEFLDEVEISAIVTLTDPTYTADQQFFATFDATGTGDVSGPAVPEPATLMIWSLLGLFSMGAYGWRRRGGAWRKGTTESIHEMLDSKRG
ncbi:MAG: PEP-CTERM sorting domain-containing protein [Candidatus Nealsonbacteria bacterium]|nr:PEP-CTERM sorting domain-containing protein [Candidatus Nealsonbacteria bacterium]